MACAALKRHVLVVAGMACAVALLLLILAASSARLETFKVKLTSDEFPQNDNLQHSVKPLQNAATAIADAWSSSSLSALPLRDGDASEPSGWVKMALKLGYFRFCYEYKLHFDPFVSPSGNSSAQDAKVSGCQTIAHKCEFNLMKVLEPMGYDPSTQPDDLVYQLEHLPLLGDCALFNASRAFVVLTILSVIATAILLLLLWRKHVKIGVVGIMAIAAVVMGAVGLALSVTVHQNDTHLQALNFLGSQLPHSPSVQLGASFILLVFGLLLVVIATVCIGVEMWQRPDSDRRLPYHARLQDNDVGMVHQPGTAYRQF